MYFFLIRSFSCLSLSFYISTYFDSRSWEGVPTHDKRFELDDP